MARETQKLDIPVEVAYGSLSLFTSILHNVFLLYHVDMFVSVYKIDKASFWIGEIIFLVWNSLNDPVFGWMSDSKYLKGKEYSKSNVIQQRLNALLWTGPLFTLSFISFWLRWTYPGLQFVICLCLYDGFLTMIDLHHSALMADMSVSAEIRTKLNSRSSLFSIVGSGSVFISYAVWNKDNLSSFRIFCVLLATLSFVGFIIMVKLLKESFHEKRVQTDIGAIDSNDDISSRQKLLSFVKELNKQTNFKWFAVMNLVQVFHCHFNSNFFPLFLENLLGAAISPGFGSFLIGISFVAPHINNLYFLSLCRRFGVYAVIRILFLVKLAISVFMFLAGPNYTWLLCLFIASNRVFTEGMCKLLNLVISDLVDEDCVMHRRSQAVSALMFGTSALLNRVFTEGTCKLLNLVISDLVDEDCVMHRRGQAVSALIFRTSALLNRVFTEGTCKLLNLVISDLVDEDCVMHRRSQAVSALMFGTSALLNRVFAEGTCKLLNLVISDLVDEDYVMHRRSQAVSDLMFGTSALLSISDTHCCFSIKIFNRVFTEGTCKLLNLVISDLVDEDCVMHRRGQAVSALMFGTSALLSKPGQTLAPLIGTWLLTQQTGHDIFQTGSEYGSIKSTGLGLDPQAQAEYRLGCFNLLVYVPIICAIVQLAVWTQFNLHGRKLDTIKAIRQNNLHFQV